MGTYAGIFAAGVLNVHSYVGPKIACVVGAIFIFTGESYSSLTFHSSISSYTAD